MYDIPDYGRMIAFGERTAAYARALEATITPGSSVVLDIGCGTGILTFLACRSGAAKVYALESDDIIEVARELAANNGYLDRIEFIQALSTEVELPRKVDAIVTDMHGVLPPFRTNVISILDARDRLLKQGGWIIPRSETIFAALTCCPELYTSFTDIWDTEYGFDFVRARTLSTNNFYSSRLKSDQMLVRPKAWTIMDYTHLDHHNFKGALSWIIDRRVTAHGLCMWYDCETVPGIFYSNSPDINGPYVFRHAFFPWPEAVELMPGDQARIALRADLVEQEYVWSWNTELTSECGELKARFQQSTFNGLPLSRERLRKCAQSFVPVTNEHWRIDFRTLELMRQRMTVGEIADKLLSEFPAYFKDRTSALARAGELSAKYSR